MRVRSTGILLLTLLVLGSSQRSYATQAQMKQLESALAFFEMDNGRFPTTEEGLAALVQAPAGLSSTYRRGGYLQGGVPSDSWGNPYQYACPPTRNATGFDLWSLGADGVPGGTDIDADIGNWPGGVPEYEPESNLPYLAAGAALGFVVGLPIYVAGCILAVRRGCAWRTALVGAPLAALIYLTAVGAVGVFLLAFTSIS